MLCEPTCLDKKEIDGDNLIINLFIKLKILTTNIDKLLVCQQCEQEKSLQMKLEEGNTRKTSFIILRLIMI